MFLFNTCQWFALLLLQSIYIFFFSAAFSHFPALAALVSVASNHVLAVPIQNGIEARYDGGPVADIIRPPLTISDPTTLMFMTISDSTLTLVTTTPVTTVPSTTGGGGGKPTL